jgi:predicted nucleic acid-binding protein
MMKSFVVDNSVVMSWCFKSDANKYGDAVLDILAESTALVPPIWPLEIVNVLLVAERRNRLKQVDSVRFITLLSQLPIVVEHEGPERKMKDLLSLGRATNLSSYDAAYLDVAMRNDCPIATLDKKLIEAAKNVDVTTLKL